MRFTAVHNNIIILLVDREKALKIINLIERATVSVQPHGCFSVLAYLIFCSVFAVQCVLVSDVLSLLTQQVVASVDNSLDGLPLLGLCNERN